MKEYLPFSKIEYQGPDSDNPLAFKYYDAERMVAGKKMADHLRFALAYWHTFDSQGQDPFGEATRTFAWDKMEAMEKAKVKIEIMFELLEKLNVKYFTFHDRDLLPEGDNLEEYFKNLKALSDIIKGKMDQTGIKLLWNTSNLTNHHRFAAGAATSPDFNVFITALKITKNSLDIAKKLNAENFVFWGGREGYETLLNTNTAQELNQMALFFKLAKNYAQKINFQGQFLIEPKAKEPMKHQYDFDVSAVMAFILKYELHFLKINIEQNHALLAGHTYQHELRFARENNLLGSLDANQGDYLLGWDTDQFPSSVYEATLAMLEVLKNGGISPGGLNFDAKLRRQSNDLFDLAYATIMGMDVYAKGLLAATKIIAEGKIDDFVKKRYQSWTTSIAKKVWHDNFSLEEIIMLESNENRKLKSSRQEMLEAIVNQAIDCSK